MYQGKNHDNHSQSKDGVHLAPDGTVKEGGGIKEIAQAKKLRLFFVQNRQSLFVYNIGKNQIAENGRGF